METSEGTRKIAKENLFTGKEDITLLKDVDGTSYKAGDTVNIEEIRTLQNINLGTFYKKLRQEGSAVEIACFGDSLTYGHDTASTDKRPADTTLTDAGQRHGTTRASTTYPEALEVFMNQLYTNVTVVNKGYSGDHIKLNMERYFKKHNANLSIAMFGTNDSRASYVPEEIRGNLEAYIKWYEQLIIREVLWGKAIVLIKPPKLKGGGDFAVEVFGNTLDLLGQRFGVPVLDGEAFTLGHLNIYSDGAHFNGEGYKIFASRVASAIHCENMTSPVHVFSGTKLLSRRTIDGFSFKDGYGSNSTGAYTPAEDSSGGGVCNAKPNGSVSYSFYNNVEDLLVIPNYYVASGVVKIVLDYEVQAGENYLDPAVDMQPTAQDRLANSIELTIPTGKVCNKEVAIKQDIPLLRIPHKGWHTITIINKSNDNLVWNGLEFIGFDEYKVLKNLVKSSKNKVPALEYYTHTKYPADTPTTEIRIPRSDFGNLFDLTSDYWRHPMVRVTISCYQQGAKVYGFLLGSTKDQSKFMELESYGNSSLRRTISNIVYEHETQEVVITLDGTPTDVANIRISI